MSSPKTGLVVGVMVLLAWLGGMLTTPADAQFLGEQNAAMSMNDNLSGGSVGPSINSSFNPIQRARDASSTVQGGYQKQGYGGTAPGGGMPGGFAPGGGAAFGGATPGGPASGTPALSSMTPAQIAAAVAARVSSAQITVITGTRVFDAVTKELLDDAVKKKVPEAEKKNYYDDGTHGDLVAGDQEYTRIDGEEHEWLSQSNQRVKEQLVQSLVVAEGYNPIEFYGYTVMSTDRSEAAPRNRAWTMAPDPKGGQGQVLVEHPVDKPLQVPKFREKMGEKDAKVKNDWSYRFLQEYRENKDNLTSKYYPLYIPLPPQVPTVAPPANWKPFQDPTALIKSEQQKVQQLMMQTNSRGGMGGGMGPMGGGYGGGGGMGGGRR